MSNLINVDAEAGANIIGDDAEPTLTLQNSSTGPGLLTKGLAVVSSASIDRADLSFANTKNIAVSSIASIARLRVGGPILAGKATIVNFSLTGGSVASGAVFALTGDSFVSTATIMVDTAVAADTGAIRVVKPDGTFGWIAIWPDAAVTAIVL